MNKIIKVIILIGIFILPIVNARITQLLGFSFGLPVNGNFEFTKVMFFNIWSSIVILLFFVTIIYDKDIKYGKSFLWVLFFYITLIISTYFSLSPYVSFFGNQIKGHNFFMWSNLAGLFIVFSNILDKSLLKKIIITLIFSGMSVSIIGLKEYFYPIFWYGDLGNRLFSTFGHPNYVSIFLVSLMPFLYSSFSPLSSARIFLFQSIVLCLFLLTLLLTKSVLAIFLFICFNVFYINSKFGLSKFFFKKRVTGVLCAIICFLTGSVIIFSLFPEKLHSFVSRFFIWETAIKIIFSDAKIFFIGGGLETFTYYFNNYKGEYLYIFENISFTADRPHNIILNFFYHFGLFGCILMLGIFAVVFKNIIKLINNLFDNSLYNTSLLSLLIILLFILLNPTSIVLYLIIVILLGFIFNMNIKKTYFISSYIYTSLLLIITSVSIIGAFFSYKFYISEIEVYNDSFSQANNIYPFSPNNHYYIGNFKKGLAMSGIKTPSYYRSKIYYNTDNIFKKDICDDYVKAYNFAETYFSCGDTFWNLDKKSISLDYYNKGLELLPDLWNKDSDYYNKFLIKHFNITGNRFLSKKYGLARVLERTGK